jgi:hypothetical protein
MGTIGRIAAFRLNFWVNTKIGVLLFIVNNLLLFTVIQSRHVVLLFIVNNLLLFYSDTRPSCGITIYS